jgi:adenylate cyclase
MESELKNSGTAMAQQSLQRKLAAILSADVKGYSRLMGEDEVATIRTLTAYREVMTQLIEQHRGRVVDSPGDNMLAEFTSVLDAVQAAVTVQKQLQELNSTLPDSRKMEFRIGINVGDVIVEGDRIYGDGVNIAARLESLAEPGGVCISGAVYDQVENKLLDFALKYESLGEQAVKNIAKPVTAYRICLNQKPTDHGNEVASPLRTTLSKPSSALTLPDKPSIAVLPFANLSGDVEQEYFSDGITEDLITDLSKLSGLFVISRNSVFLYKGKAAKPDQIGQDLGVRYMLEGSVRKAANCVRITAQLVDVTTGYQLWADRYDRELQDIFAVQDEVTRKIVSALEVKLTTSERKRLGRPSTSNLDAYEYFLRGLESYYSRRTQETNLQARGFFAQAITLDPQFAAAHAWLGRTHVVEWLCQWTDDWQTLERAETSAQQAIALEAAQPTAHATLAYVYIAKRQYEQAIVAAEKAVDLDPNDPDACLTLSEVLCYGGERLPEALGLVQKAMRLNPHYPVSYLSALALAYYFLGRQEEAVMTLQRALVRDPDHEVAHFFLAILYREEGKIEAARAELQACAELTPQDSLENVIQRLPIRNASLLERWQNLLRDIWPQLHEASG